MICDFSAVGQTTSCAICFNRTTVLLRRSWRWLVPQLGCSLSDPVCQRTLDDVVAQDVNQRTDETIAV